MKMRPHIHIDYKSQKLCEIWLDKLEVKKVYGISRHEVNALLKLVSKNRDNMIDFWNEIFEDKL